MGRVIRNEGGFGASFWIAFEVFWLTDALAGTQATIEGASG
jgi:hypothetical protein